jgi:hypothetical protein
LDETTRFDENGLWSFQSVWFSRWGTLLNTAEAFVENSASAAEEVPDEMKAAIVLFFSMLDEKQRRLYAGLESLKLGYGGDQRIAAFLGMDPHTVAKGRRELIEQDFALDRIREAGGGRKPVEKKRPKSSPESKS